MEEINNPEYKVKVFRPTIEELKEFKKYIEYMESAGAHKAGLAKLILPKEFEGRKGGYPTLRDIKIKTPIRQKIKPVKDEKKDVIDGVYKLQQVKDKTEKSYLEYKYYAYADNPTPPHFDSEDLESQAWAEMTKLEPIYGCEVDGYLMDNEIFNLKDLDTPLRVLGPGNRGIVEPFLYFGAWRTMFPWYTEDLELYSLNYMHFGYAKTWYSIPPSFREKVEELLATLYPDEFRKCPAFLRHKESLVHPKIFRDHGIPCNSMDQRKGELMVSFPNGFHCGFNHGFNCAESVNAIFARWPEYGKRGAECVCKLKNKEPIDLAALIREVQPDRYPFWLIGKDEGTHPEDPTGTSFIVGKDLVIKTVRNPKDNTFDRKTKRKVPAKKQVQPERRKINSDIDLSDNASLFAVKRRKKNEKGTSSRNVDEAMEDQEAPDNLTMEDTVGTGNEGRDIVKDEDEEYMRRAVLGVEDWDEDDIEAATNEALGGNSPMEDDSE